MSTPRITVASVALLTVVGLALRLPLLGDSLVADELSTRWMVMAGGVWDVIAKVHTDAEITPPLSFVASWLTTRIAFEPELLRLPSLLAGTATIPLVYLVGARTVGRRAALVATAFAALSPFLMFYATEARGYALMIALVLLSTYALLRAVDRRGTRWWVVYAIAACGAVYSHYTSVFALAAQLAWALWAHPAARKPLLVATGAAALGFAPWLGGLVGDMRSPTTDILSVLQPFTLPFVRTTFAHWVLAHPYGIEGTGVSDLPGIPALIMLFAAVAIGAGALALRVLRARPRPSAGIVLVVALAAATPLGEAAISAVGSNLLGTRNLAASWPALALCLAALITAAGPRLGVAAAALAVTAFAIGAVTLLGPDFGRGDFKEVAAEIERRARPGDVVVDGALVTPAGVPGPLPTALDGDWRVFPIGNAPVQYDPFRLLGPAPPVEEVLRDAAAAAGGHRLFLVLQPGRAAQDTLAALPPGYRPTYVSREYPGITPLQLVVAERQTASGA